MSRILALTATHYVSRLIQISWLKIAVIGVSFCTVAQAGELPEPTGPVVLTITGKIRLTNANDADGKEAAEFDRAMLESIGTTTRKMETAWTESQIEFEGVTGIEVLRFVGASGSTISAFALNDYAIDIPLSDFENYPVMLALKMNGEYMRVRDKGPVWVIYPEDAYPELSNPATRRKWVWQLNALHIE